MRPGPGPAHAGLAVPPPLKDFDNVFSGLPDCTFADDLVAREEDLEYLDVHAGHLEERLEHRDECVEHLDEHVECEGEPVGHHDEHVERPKSTPTTATMTSSARTSASSAMAST